MFVGESNSSFFFLRFMCFILSDTIIHGRLLFKLHSSSLDTFSSLFSFSVLNTTEAKGIILWLKVDVNGRVFWVEPRRVFYVKLFKKNWKGAKSLKIISIKFNKLRKNYTSCESVKKSQLKYSMCAKLQNFYRKRIYIYWINFFTSKRKRRGSCEAMCGVCIYFSLRNAFCL